MLPPVGVLLSGGLDSSILLAKILREERRVQPIYVRSGLTWEREELDAIRRFLTALDSPHASRLVVLDQPVEDIYGRHWSVTGDSVPDATSPDEAVYMPGRNALLLLKSLLWCARNGIDELALGTLAANPFADATGEFFDPFEEAMGRAVGRRVRVVRPFEAWTKQQVMEFGRDLPLEQTFSCIAPVTGRHCGACNKCAERMAAFRLLEITDPTNYASAVTAAVQG